jgi:hypothetical protein
MSQEKPYRLTFYESGYIIPEKFETLEYKDFATDCCGLKPVLYETDMDSKAIDKMLGLILLYNGTDVWASHLKIKCIE